MTRFLNPSQMHTPRGYTHVVEVTGGRIVFIAGQVALDASGNMVGAGDFRAQAVQVFENLKTALESVGADFSHVVKFGIFVLDVNNLPILREVRDQYVNTANPPASTAVQVAALFQPGYLLEIEAVAVVP
ncbi:MAG TPA: RidA family protein [Oceanobacillus sp.]|nr:RidA family protein [Oceanobacillus sp.]